MAEDQQNQSEELKTAIADSSEASTDAVVVEETPDKKETPPETQEAVETESVVDSDPVEDKEIEAVEEPAVIDSTEAKAEESNEAALEQPGTESAEPASSDSTAEIPSEEPDTESAEPASSDAPAETPSEEPDTESAEPVSSDAPAETPSEEPDTESAEPVSSDAPEETPSEEPVVEDTAAAVEDTQEAKDQAVVEDAPEVEEPGAESTEEPEDSSPVEEPVALEEDSVTDPSDGIVESVEDVLAPVATPEFSEGMLGYTGKITGDVVKLEDLDSIQDEEEDVIGLDRLRSLVESTLTNVSEHEIVTGRVVSLGEKDVVIDIGFKSDGIVSRGEFDEDLKTGDEVEVYLERIEDYHGQLVLSKTKADTVRRWRRIETAYENEEVLEGTIVRRIKGGMIVELFEGMEAFLPGSQIDVRPVRDFDSYLEKRMEFKIVKLNPINENIVVSHKALIEKDLQEQRQTILSSMEPGQILEGAVKNITDFGVFIDLGGVDGLLHITDLSWGRVSHPSELVSLDEELNVVVLDYDKERQRISLGLKQLQPHPWDKIEEKFTKDKVVEGKVVSITDYGAFVELEKGIEGLVHISEMSWTEHIRHPSQMVSLGQLVPVKILNIDTEGKKISLGMKQLEPDPWENIAERYPPGTVMRGKVRNITNFGVFVEIEPGIDGLVHISDLSWTKRIRHPSEMVKKGLELDVVVLNIDTSDRRISLGHKQVDTNPWNHFAEVYAEGQRSQAKVVRLEEKGLVVELPLEVEAFVPSKELRNASSMAQAYPIDHVIEDMLVIRFVAAQKEIILSEIASERAKEQEERRAEQREKREVRQQEQKEITRYRKKAGASGPTTLGELSGLADLKAKLEAEESEQKASSAVNKSRAKKKTDVAAEPEAVAGVDAESEETAEPVAEIVAEPEAAVEAEADAVAEPETAVETGTEEVEVEPVVEEKPKKRGRKKKVEEKAKEEEAAPEVEEKTEEKVEEEEAAPEVEEKTEEKAQEEEAAPEAAAKEKKAVKPKKAAKKKKSS